MDTIATPEERESQDVMEQTGTDTGRRSLEDLFKEFEGTYCFEEVDWGPPVGQEIW